MSTPSSTRTHVCFHTPLSSDILATPASYKKKTLRLSEASLTTPIKLACRKSFGTNAETDICSTKVSINKNILKPSFYILDNLERTREDAYGTFIIKGRKNHKVTFIDNISNQKIAEVILVDSFTSKKSSKDTCECKCSTGCIIL